MVRQWETVMLIPNFTKPNARALTGIIAKRLAAHGCILVMSRKYEGMVDGVLYGEFEEMMARCDVVVTVGGDGTILHSARHAVDHNKPLLGVNAGRLGYLAQMEPDELYYLDLLFSGEYVIQERMLLEASIDGGEPFIAFNDITVSGPSFRLVDLEVCEDGDPIGIYRADGLIAATPTGSTAYSMSAGGPIVDSAVDAILLTPICPHSLYARTVLFRPEAVLEIQSRCINHPANAAVSADGREIAQLDENNALQIRKSQQRLKLISFADKKFGRIIHEKLQINR